MSASGIIASLRTFVARWKNALKVLVGLSALVWLFFQVDLVAVGEALKQTHFGLLLLSFLLYVLLVLVSAWRLHLLLKGLIDSFSTTFHLVMVSTFFNSFLPGGYGGDGYKVIALKQRSESWSKVLTLVSLDRITSVITVLVAGVAYLLFVGVPPAFLEDSVQLQPREWSIYVMLAVGAALAAMLIAGIFIARKLHLFRRVGNIARNVGRTLMEVSPSVYLAVVILSLVTVLLRWVRFAVYLMCIGGFLPFSDWIFVLFIMHIVMLAPITVGGLGLQEGAIALALASLGVPLAEGIAVSLLNRITIWLAALAGGIVFLTGRAPAPSTQ